MSNVFGGGIPTKIDVDKLIEKFGVPKEGETFHFEELSLNLALGKNTYRFKTVIDAWRKKIFRDHNVLLVSIGGGVLKASNPDERIDYANRKVASGRRAVGKAIVVAYGTDDKRLDDKGRESRKGILSMNESKLRLAASVASKV